MYCRDHNEIDAVKRCDPNFAMLHDQFDGLHKTFSKLTENQRLAAQEQYGNSSKVVYDSSSPNEVKAVSNSGEMLRYDSLEEDEE